MTLTDKLQSLSWLSICLYSDAISTFGTQSSAENGPGLVTYLFGLTTDCKLFVSDLGVQNISKISDNEEESCVKGSCFFFNFK